MSDRSAHILLVDPDPSICDLMTTLFTDAGFVVTACTSPQQATTLLSRSVFDLVITDSFTTLPEAIASSTAEVIGRAGRTPVALFTAHVIDAANAQAAGFRDLIAKPFDLDHVVRQIGALLAPEPTVAERCATP